MSLDAHIREALDGEEHFQWLVRPELNRYVRVGLTLCRWRQTPINPRESYGRLVGWSVLRNDADAILDGGFVRRIFWVAAHDPYPFPGQPIESVDPYSLLPGHIGRVTPRSWGGPLPPDVRARTR